MVQATHGCADANAGRIRQDYANDPDVGSLAREGNLGGSTFHHALGCAAPCAIAACEEVSESPSGITSAQCQKGLHVALSSGWQRSGRLPAAVRDWDVGVRSAM
jgi:hypothetical protein